MVWPYLLENASLKMKERIRAAVFVTAARILLSDSDVADCRAMISVVFGCRNVPGEGGGVEKGVCCGEGFVGVKPRFCAFCARKPLVLFTSRETTLRVFCSADVTFVFCTAEVTFLVVWMAVSAVARTDEGTREVAVVDIAMEGKQNCAWSIKAVTILLKGYN